jgi:phenylpropionate dioxygenase-like ring-hydroxylating dioxygenase large terminal subunit
MLSEIDFVHPTGPMLADGRMLSEFFDFEKREVSMAVLSDPEIYRLELDRLFARSWVILGHESEIPNVGDFVLRNIGEDSVIVTRADSGEIHVLLNVCSHRGMEVCWADRGNQDCFKCPYHGWSFDGEGKLLGAPYERQMYGDWDKSQYGLTKAQVSVTNGLIFGNLDPQAPRFEDTLGDMSWYIDYATKDTEYEPLGPPTRLLLGGNWKILTDQVTGDMLHGLSLHQSTIEMGIMTWEAMAGTQDIVKVIFPDVSHSVFSINPGINSRRASRLEARDEVAGEGEEEQYGIDGRDLILLLQPHSQIFTMHMALPDGTGIPVLKLTAPNPKGPDNFMLWSLDLVPKGTSEEAKAMLRLQQSLGTDFILVDDAQQAPSMQRVAKWAVGKRQTMKFFSIAGPNRPDNWPGPGEVYAGWSKDDTQWNFWTGWLEAMTANERAASPSRSASV